MASVLTIVRFQPLRPNGGRVFAIGRKFLIQDALAARWLVTPTKIEIPGREDLATCLHASAHSQRIQMFLQWVKQEVVTTIF